MDADLRRNDAGGHGFAVADDVAVLRFLTLGATGSTYYVTRRELTDRHTALVTAAARELGVWLTEQIVAVSTAGRAPRPQPATFALAAVAGLGDEAGRAAALAALPRVCRTGTHLFRFAADVQRFRGWGRSLRRAVGAWYADRPDTTLDDLALQVIKYRHRGGWSHRDLLRLTHPATDEPARRALFDWVCGREVDLALAPALVGAFARARAANTVAQWTALIAEYPLTWEMLPDAALAEPAVWRALIAAGMAQTALIRQLPRLTRLGVLTGDTAATVLHQLTDPDRLRAGRVHPIGVLLAHRTYAAGQGASRSRWTPDPRVVAALDEAFHRTFAAIEPAGGRTLLALDVSGSMAYESISGMALSPREASAALALVTAATEPDATIVGFTGGLTPLPIAPGDRLDDAVAAVSDLPFGVTDCAAPMLWAAATGQRIDTFCLYTDNQTWAGRVHPHQALQRYRDDTGIPARLVVCAMTATDVSIADPDDPGMLDVVGFDAATPSVIAGFARGEL